MRDAASRIIREIGVETGGSNIQFAVNPDERPDGRHRDEPARVALLGAGVEGDRLPDREDRRQARARLHARRDPATTSRARRRPPSSRPSTTSSSRSRAGPSRSSRRPTDTLTTQMKSVGEAMAIGRTFKEAFLKARALARDRRAAASAPTANDGDGEPRTTRRSLRKRLAMPNDRADVGRRSTRFERGWTHRGDPRADEDRSVVPASSSREIVDDGGRELPRHAARRAVDADLLRSAKRDRASATRSSRTLLGRDRGRRSATTRKDDGHRAGLQARRHLRAPSSRRSRRTIYSHLRRRGRGRADDANEGHHPRRRPEPHRPGHRVRLLLLPRRLRAARKTGFETVMVNCNPETVSTDYDTARPALLRAADVRGRDGASSSARSPTGVIVQFGGQTPLKLARAAASRPGVPIIGTSPDAIDLAEDRERFAALLDGARPAASRASGTARTVRRGARRRRARIGYPGARAAVVRARRPRAWRSSTTTATLDGYMTQRGRRVARAAGAGRQVPRGRDRGRRRRASATATARRHRRHHGAHRGGRHPLRRQRLRRAAVHLPPSGTSTTIRDYTRRIARELEGRRPDERAVRDQGRRGLRARGQPARVAHRAVRRKATGVPLAKLAARVMVGRDARRARLHRARSMPAHCLVKRPVFPFVRFPGVDTMLGPGDEVDRRGDGRRRLVRRRVRQGAARRRQRLPRERHGVRQRRTTTTRPTCCRSRAPGASSASA